MKPPQEKCVQFCLSMVWTTSPVGLQQQPPKGVWNSSNRRAAVKGMEVSDRMHIDRAEEHCHDGPSAERPVRDMSTEGRLSIDLRKSMRNTMHNAYSITLTGLLQSVVVHGFSLCVWLQPKSAEFLLPRGTGKTLCCPATAVFVTLQNVVRSTIAFEMRAG